MKEPDRYYALSGNLHDEPPGFGDAFIEVVCVEYYDTLKAERQAMIDEMQRYQPAGSPPPGGPELLLRHILSSMRAENLTLQADVDAGRKLWRSLVDTRQAWGEDQDQYVEMGLLVYVPVGSIEAPCEDCPGDCDGCYRLTALLASPDNSTPNQG